MWQNSCTPLQRGKDGSYKMKKETEDGKLKIEKDSDNVNFPREGVSQVDECQQFERKPYQDRYYLLYGKEDDAEPLDLETTQDYLSGVGFEDNAFKRARDGKKIAEHIEATFKPAKAGSRYCDFCGTELFGVEYETLSDGRDRCMICGRTAIKTEEEFKKIFQDVKRNMESFFGIKFNADIRIEMVNSQTLHKRLGQAYIPTPAADGRVLGVAISDKNGYTLLVENGSPRMASMLTMAHELTHIWQYLNWDDKEIRRRYGNNLRLQIYEGMAKWVEIQYAYLINEPAVAKREEIITSYRQDEYGFGFLRYRANYPFSTGTVITRPTPFMNPNDPLSPQYCREIQTPYSEGTEIDARNKKQKKDKNSHKRAAWWILLIVFVALVLVCALFVKGKTSETSSNDVKTTTEEEKKKEEKEKDEEEKDETEGEDKKEESKQKQEEQVPYFAYAQLSEDEKKVYDAVYEAFVNFESKLTSLPVEMSVDDYFRIEDCIEVDHPELFWHRGGNTAYSDQTTGMVKSVDILYCMTQDEAQKRQAEIDAVVQPFLDTLDESMSDYEIAKAAYEFIINSIDYDTITMEEQKASWDMTDRSYPDDIRSIYGVFVNKKAVCVGYAKAMQYILQYFQRECAHIWNEDHAWNLVKMGENYYYIDATWGDGSNTLPDKDVTDRVNYDFLGLTTAELQNLEDHTIINKLDIPQCTATEYNYHYHEGLVADAYNYDKIKEIIMKEIQAGNSNVTIKFINKQVYDECLNNLVNNGQMAQIINEANVALGKNINTSYTYYKDERLYTIGFELTGV